MKTEVGQWGGGILYELQTFKRGKMENDEQKQK